MDSSQRVKIKWNESSEWVEKEKQQASKRIFPLFLPGDKYKKTIQWNSIDI